MNVMNLEIDDYLKAIESLNEKLQCKQTECQQIEDKAKTLQDQQNILHSEIGE